MAAAIGSSLITLLLYRGGSLADIWTKMADISLQLTFISPFSFHMFISFCMYFHRPIIKLGTVIKQECEFSCIVKKGDSVCSVSQKVKMYKMHIKKHDLNPVSV